MGIADEMIIGGVPLASEAQAETYLYRSPAPYLTEDDVIEIVYSFRQWGKLVGIRWDVAYAQSCHETNRYLFGNQVRLAQRNPAGIGATNDGAEGLTFPDWNTGIAAYFVHLLAWCDRLDLAARITPDPLKLDPRIPLVAQARATKGKATTWASLGGRWAVPGVGYGAAIERHHNAIVALPQPPGAKKEPTMPKIALASGHHNSSGGDAFEKEQTGPLCAAVAKYCRALGMDVRVVQPNDGMGTIDGSLDVVGNTVVKWTDSGWVPDIFLECHTEGDGGTGVFAIYPDWAGDVDTDVRDKLGPLVSKAVALATGLKLGAGGDGVMSEKQTGVGGDGFRLGIFRTTAPIAADTTRLIIEYGAHDKQPDLAIAKAPGFAEKCGKATAAAFAAFLGLPTQPNAGSVVEAPAAPAENGAVRWYLNDKQEPIVEINFGGRAKAIEGVNLADVGVSVIGTDDATYDRSLQAGAFKPYTRRTA